MANIDMHAVQSPDEDVKIFMCNFTTNNTSDPTAFSSNILSVVYSATGLFAVTLKPKHKYKQLLGVGQPCVVGTNAARGFIRAIDQAAGTFTIGLYNSSDAAATTTGDVIYVQLFMKNSAQQRRG